MNRCLMLAGAAAVITLLPPLGDAQAFRRRGLEAARQALSAGRLDGAALLVHQVLDSAAAAPPAERIEGWLLLGVIQFYQGNDSGTAADFREALALEPRLEPSGLARYDSTLAVLFEAQRTAIAARRDSEGSLTLVRDVENCIPTCRKGVTPPKVLHMPEPSWEPSSPDQLPGGRGRLVIRYVVTTQGRIAPRSIVVVSSSVPLSFQSALALALSDARFEPGRVGDHPVAILQEDEAELSVDRVRYNVMPRMSPP